MTFTRPFFIALTLLFVASCGRSSADPCRAREGLTCPSLDGERAAARADFDDAVKAGVPVGNEGDCVQALVSEQLERGCIADPCAELCSLHPCALRDPAADCTGGCQALLAAGRVDLASIDAAVVRAAGRPGLCTCAVCDSASQALCDELWVCAAEPRSEPR